MSKTKKIVLAISILLIVVAMTVAAITSGSMNEITCIECHGAGEVEKEVVACSECVQGLKDHQIIGGVDEKACEICEETLCSTKYSYIGECEANTCVGKDDTTPGMVRGSFWALVPPIIAIGLALITKEVYSSLFVGILSGALLYGNFKPLESMDALINDGLIGAVSGSAGIFVFLVELGIVVALVNRAGGAAAFGRWAQKHIKSRVGTLLATFALGVLIFIDDYFNCLTVGSVMLPATDSHKISRAKLAYIIDATAAPVCMIAPISSWAAAVSKYAEDGEGLSLFISAIPFNFYSLLTLVFVVALAFMGFDYGSMRIHEFNAKNKGDLHTSGEVQESAEAISFNEKGRVIDLLLPIIVLIVTCVFAMVYVGGIFKPDVDLIKAFGDTDATVALPWGGLIALVILMIYYAIRKLMSVKEMMEAVPAGFIAMVPAILILTFATSLKNMTDLLGARYFVADLMNGVAGEVAMFLPAIIFLVACFLAFATGTSWGTFGILIPIVLAIFVEDPTMRTIGMSACLAGAVCGDHCSPISDTTIMSSAGAKCNHINHVSTQMPYALTVAGLSFVMFIIAGFVKNAWICLPIGVALTVGTLFVIRLVVKNKEKKQA